MKNIYLPLKVYTILATLQQNGYEGYVVGGCVRDSLLGKKPTDWDVTTSAQPEEIKKIFKKTVDTGIAHGTVTVIIDQEAFEVTTYRIEGEYVDYRRPTEVAFTTNIIEDLKRRDFTMNAIAYHPAIGFVDPFQGREDIQKQIIRCVGNPEERFQEDALRMLRAVRFLAQLGFTIDPKTQEAIWKQSVLIKHISVERIREEMNKILLSPHPKAILTLEKVGLLQYILPEFQACIGIEQNHPYHRYTVAEHTLKTVEAIPATIPYRWTMLLHDIGKVLTKTIDEKGVHHFYGHVEKSYKLAREILTRLKFDHKTAKIILRLIEAHDDPIQGTERGIRRVASRVGEDLFLDLLAVKKADIKGKNPSIIEESLADLDRIEELYKKIKEEEHCMSIKDLAINGQDLKQIGFKQGKEIGEILKKLLVYVIEEPKKNTKEDLIALAKKHRN
ncbi:MAG: CCA tRNA nucleotidyltransferase [Epulopiscium sp.]|nr:CCA tRNA nucleotidyltransferase [Candidatus Epulonipiscium sp.]